MEVIQGKPIGEALAREPQFYTPISRETNASEPDPTKKRNGMHRLRLQIVVRLA